MEFRLWIHTDNAAFYDADDYAPRHEIARILRKVAEHVEQGEPIGKYQTIHDVNGNDVGRFALKETD